MKLRTALVLFMVLLGTTSVTAQDCRHIGRATTTDQKSMAIDVALKYLGAEIRDVLYLETSQYVSWKDNQKGCLADVVHFAKIKVITKSQEGERCQTVLDLHTKDYFVDRIDYSREYKARNVQIKCQEESARESQALRACEAKGPCPIRTDGLLIRDLFDDCKCKYLGDMVRFENVVEQYQGFYSPQTDFPKPDHISSPF